MKTCGPDGRPDDVTKKGKNWQSPEYCVNFTNKPEWVEKASWETLHLLDGHSEQRPSSAQPYLGGGYQTGSE